MKTIILSIISILALGAYGQPKEVAPSKEELEKEIEKLKKEVAAWKMLYKTGNLGLL